MLVSTASIKLNCLFGTFHPFSSNAVPTNPIYLITKHRGVKCNKKRRRMRHSAEKSGAKACYSEPVRRRAFQCFCAHIYIEMHVKELPKSLWVSCKGWGWVLCQRSILMINSMWFIVHVVCSSVLGSRSENQSKGSIR